MVPGITPHGSARALLLAVEAGTTSTPSQLIRAGVQSLAVYPLRWVGPSADEWIAQGLTDDLQDSLCMVSGLRVKARAAMHDGDDARAHGRRTGVDLVVDGSVRRHGEGVRVQLRLSRVQDGEQRCSGREDAALGASGGHRRRVGRGLKRASAGRPVVRLGVPGLVTPYGVEWIHLRR